MTEADEIFEMYHDRILRYVLGFVREKAEAEDLTQETFLRAYSRRETLRDPDAARGWLYRIATRVCLDRLRQRVPQARLEVAESVAAPSRSAQEVAERQETSACVQRCLDFLSDSYRAVILLHEGHNLTAAEIADLMGENVGAVKIRLHRARRKLEQIMTMGCAVSTGSGGVPCCEPKR